MMRRRGSQTRSRSRNPCVELIAHSNNWMLCGKSYNYIKRECSKRGGNRARREATQLRMGEQMIATEATMAPSIAMPNQANDGYHRRQRGASRIRHRKAATMILYRFQRLCIRPGRDALTVRDLCDEMERHGVARETTRAAVRELYLDGKLERIGKSGGWHRVSGYRYRLPLEA